MNNNKITCLKFEPGFYLHYDCWERVFTFLIAADDNRNFMSLSLVSKHFLSITNHLLSSLTISDPVQSFLTPLFRRFSNLNSLSLWFSFRKIANNANCVRSQFIGSLVTLKGLTSLHLCKWQISDDLLYSIAREALPLKTFVLQNCTGYSYDGIYYLLCKCQTIQHLGLQQDSFINNHHIANLSLILPHLVSINLSLCFNLTKSSWFALIRNCLSLGEIIMNFISFENSDFLKDLVVRPQVKSLGLAFIWRINDETITMFATVFPNLQFLNLSNCHRISEKGIYQILSRCCRIRHLNLSQCSGVRLLKMNFVIPQLEVLNLSGTDIDDKTLYEISKSCRGLLELLLARCDYVTRKGVISVVKNCTKLKEIDLRYCNEVDVDVVVSKVLSRKSLQKRKLFSRNGRLVFY